MLPFDPSMRGVTSITALLVLTLAPASPSDPRFPDVYSVGILPSKTDSSIREFNTDHMLYRSKAAKPRKELVVYLPGTNGKGTGAVTICSAVASFGYRVLNLSYPTSVAAAIVRNRTNRDAFLNFRLEIIEGGDHSDAIVVDRANSIENRLARALAYLRTQHPTEGWEKYLQSDGEIRWENIVVAGHSQGAGHAGVIGTRHKVARVVMTGGPRDYSRALRAPAGWYGKPATPIGRFFAFNHEQDEQGCSFEELLQNCRAMGMEEMGKAVDVDKVPAPYKNSRILTTNYPVSEITSLRAHGSVISPTLTQKRPNGDYWFYPVWKYLYTAPVEP